MIDIGTRWELMTDDYLTDRLEGNISRRLHRPAAREAIAAFDVYNPEPGAAAENAHVQICPGSILHDGKNYRLYYSALRNRYHDGDKTVSDQRSGCASSPDGISWRIEESSARRPRGGKGAVFIDGNPDCAPAQRYKGVAGGKTGGTDGPAKELWAYASPDGFAWTRVGDGPVMRGGPGRGQFDAFNLAFWDGIRGEYRLYRREVYREGPKYVATDGRPERESTPTAYREILTATSPDFVNWSEPLRLRYGGLPPQRRDAPPEQLYHNNVMPYFRAPHIFVGFPNRYVQYEWCDAVAGLPQPQRRREIIERGGVERRGTAVTDTLFMSSRNGIDFNLWSEAFLRPGPSLTSNWFYADNHFAWGIAVTPSHIPGAPDELSFYATESQKIPGRATVIRRHALRMDGFVSLGANRAGGEMITRPILFGGDTLAVNFAASAAGGVRVEIQDERGWPIPGFELESNIPLLGDDIGRVARWRDGADPGRLAGTPVRLRFRLADADLYAFGFSERRGN